MSLFHPNVNYSALSLHFAMGWGISLEIISLILSLRCVCALLEKHSDKTADMNRYDQVWQNSLTQTASLSSKLVFLEYQTLCFKLLLEDFIFDFPFTQIFFSWPKAWPDNMSVKVRPAI